MIIEVRTRTVGQKAHVKNSLSFSSLPTKAFPKTERHRQCLSDRSQSSMAAIPSQRDTIPKELLHSDISSQTAPMFHLNPKSSE